MSRFPMNPYDEQRLIEEVQYLHSLWHQDSGVGWVFPTPVESSPVTQSGWPSFTAQPSLQPHLPTAEELASVAGNRAQQQGLKAVSQYLKYSVDDDEEEMYEDDDDMEVEKGEKNLNFFAKLFEEDGGLREYYEKNNESGGEFICLVCSGVGKKGWSKRFKDCVGLVQHSITISNTRQAHRAFGQVICRILGWDINRLPSIVLSASGKPSESSDKPVEAQVLGSKLQTSSLANSNDGSNKTLQGNEDAGGKDCLSGLSNTTDAVNVGTDELSQQKQSFSNENQQENGGCSTALERFHENLLLGYLPYLVCVSEIKLSRRSTATPPLSLPFSNEKFHFHVRLRHGVSSFSPFWLLLCGNEYESEVLDDELGAENKDELSVSPVSSPVVTRQSE
ncbi:hypothetical protein MTR67_042307 [Solanum verrucosum]|uniref:Uncharacterized protein n=1 Tax=Solanum verrucosum TaxID=315347 RepID=A0AAF0UMB1_SOLVR|nr:hypothetical protein MTR67_042307 [Solanum verrucosum]